MKWALYAKAKNFLVPGLERKGRKKRVLVNVMRLGLQSMFKNLQKMRHGVLLTFNLEINLLPSFRKYPQNCSRHAKIEEKSQIGNKTEFMNFNVNKKAETI